MYIYNRQLYYSNIMMKMNVTMTSSPVPQVSLSSYITTLDQLVGTTADGCDYFRKCLLINRSKGSNI